jgi:hypothetical protein
MSDAVRFAWVDGGYRGVNRTRYVEARAGRLRRLGCLAHFMAAPRDAWSFWRRTIAPFLSHKAVALKVRR